MFNNLNEGQQETIIQNINDIGANIASTLGNFLQSMLKKFLHLFHGFQTQQQFSFLHCWPPSLSVKIGTS